MRPLRWVMTAHFEAGAWRYYDIERPLCITMKLDHLATIMSMFHADDPLLLQACDDWSIKLPQRQRARHYRDTLPSSCEDPRLDEDGRRPR